jgi:hypothetical protein
MEVIERHHAARAKSPHVQPDRRGPGSAIIDKRDRPVPGAFRRELRGKIPRSTGAAILAIPRARRLLPVGYAQIRHIEDRGLGLIALVLILGRILRHIVPTLGMHHDRARIGHIVDALAAHRDRAGAALLSGHESLATLAVIVLVGVLVVLVVVCGVGAGIGIGGVASVTLGIRTVSGTQDRRVHYHRPYQQGQDGQAHEDVGQANGGSAHNRLPEAPRGGPVMLIVCVVAASDTP